MARTPARRSSGLRVDFTGVEGRITVPEGDYEVKVKEITKETGEKADYLKWIFTITGPKHEGASLYHNTSLAPQALWNLRNLLETLGVEVPNGPLDLDLPELIDLTCGVVVIHETYEGQKKARIGDFFPLEGGEDSRMSSIEKLKADEVSDMDEKELAEIAEKYGLGIDLDPLKTIRKKVNAVLDKLEEKGFLEE